MMQRLLIQLLLVGWVCATQPSRAMLTLGIGTGTLRGYVLDRNKQPIEGITVSIQGTTRQSATDATRYFQFQDLPAGPLTVLATGVGIKNQTQEVTTVNQQIMSVTLLISESVQELREVTVRGVRAITGMGYLGQVNDNVIYSGKKTEVLLVDKLDTNTPQNNPRQVMGRVPGANYSETEGSRFPTNGIGFRELNPSQSIETNTRQNGYNITADVYGYPESYYLPPLEAVERIEVTRGASSLQFRPQFGGVINYVLRQGNPNTRLESTAITAIASGWCGSALDFCRARVYPHSGRSSTAGGGNCQR